ncbi:zf-HC2 domain-containing protein [Myxococcaceae bacterium GXIMD 01537]
MSCTFEDDLTAYVDGELPAARRAQVEAHLATCADCHATEALLRGTLEQLARLPEFVPSASMRREVLARVDALPPTLGERLRGLLRPAVLVPGAAVAGAALLALQVGGGTEPLPDVTEPGVLELAANMELAEDYDVAGLDSVDDLEVVAHLHELEVQ